MKKIFWLTAIVMLLVCVTTLCAGAAYSGTCGENLTWTLDDDGTLTISGSGDMLDWTIVLNAGKTPWYSYREKIKNVIIGDEVTSIGFNAFSYCNSLTSIEISDSVTSIGSSAFENCTSLASIEIPDSVTSIGGSAFENCTSLASIEIPDSVTSIGYEAFYNCTSLASIEIPDSVTSIGNRAFSSCSSLASIEIPNSVTSIGDSAFYNCRSLESITVDSENKNYSSDERGALFDKNKTLLIQYPIGNTANAYKILDSVTSIGNSAFENCTSIASIEIPDSVTSIGNCAFRECTSLASIEIPDSVTSIGNSVFYNCTSLTSISIGNSVTSIDNSVFYNCSSLASIEIPDSVTSIGHEAFYNCTSLASVSIPNSVTSIGYEAFYNCTSLASIEIPDSVTSIGSSAFENCTSLASIEIPDSVTIIGGSAFENCTSLASIEIPDSVTSIGDYAFSYCTRLASIEIPDSVTSIGVYAFYYCTSLASVEIPDSVTSIGNYAFSHCSSLASIEIPDSVTSIGDCAFSSCSSLASIEIPDSVTSMGNGVFSKCDSLISISIPNSVTSIGYSAFYNCYSLKTIYYNGVKSQFVKINIGINNLYFNSATVYFQGVSVTGISLNPSSLKLEQKKTAQITSTVFPENASDKSLSWSTSNANVATVVEGVVTAVSAGTAQITAVTSDGGFTASCDVTVTEPETVLDRDTVIVLDNSGSMSGTPLSELKKAAISFCNTVLHAKGINRIAIVIYDTNVRTYGFTSDIKLLETYINSMTGSGSTYMNKGLTSAASLLSGSVADVKSVVLMSDGIPSCSDSEVINAANTVKNVAHLYTLGFYHNTSSSTPAKLLDSIQDAGYYEVTDGNKLEIIFNEIGDKITRIPVTSLTIEKTEIVLVEGEHGAINASVKPHDATNKGIHWSSSNEAVATVSESGIVTAVGQGKTVITATSLDNNAMNASCDVIVNHSEAWYYTYTVKGDGTAEITGYRAGLPTDVILPMYVDRYLVTSIGSSAFRSCTSLASIEIPDSVTSIGDYAFYACTSLASVSIGNNVTNIGMFAFKDCTSLASVSIPNSVTSIGDCVFYNCTSLVSIEIPNSVTSIGVYAFYYCTSLASIEIPDSVTSISSSAFENCTSLASVSIPYSVTSIGSDAFYYCRNLKNVYYSGTEEEWNETTIGTGNTYLLNAQIHFNSKQITYTAPLPEGYETASVLLALYDENGAYIGTQIKPVTADNTSVSFVVDTTKAHSYKIILFDALDTIKPLCEDVKDNI